MPDLKPGDDVLVFDGNRRRASDDGPGVPGEVVKVGRSLVTIRWPGGEDMFRLETGRLNERVTYGYATFFLTMAECALRERNSAALAALAEHGISLHHGHNLTLEQIEALAEVARTFSATGEVLDR